jgi:hypothetical protein
MLRNSIIVLSTAMLLSTTTTGAFAFSAHEGGGTHFAAPAPVTHIQSPNPHSAQSGKPGHIPGIHPITFKPLPMLPVNTGIQNGGPLPGGGSVENGYTQQNCGTSMSCGN